MAEIKRLNSRGSALPHAYHQARWTPRRTEAAVRDRGQNEFDPVAWMAIVEEQKLRIARAAGVDPSKVRIRIGH